eukprot:3443043-Pyramimonas_sp.AAC.1
MTPMRKAFSAPRASNWGDEPRSREGGGGEGSSGYALVRTACQVPAGQGGNLRSRASLLRLILGAGIS